MPKGIPDSRTCPNCGDWCLAEWNFCPMCGENIHKRKRRKEEAKPMKEVIGTDLSGNPLIKRPKEG